MNVQTAGSRDGYWDLLKCILIFLVLYAHLLAPFSPDGSVNRCIYSTIYFFHMPLFVFISGRFSQIRNRGRYIHGILSLLATYFLLHIVWRVVPEMIDYWGGQISVFTMFKHFLSPGYTLWYLLSMVYWRLMIFAIPYSFLNKYPIMVVLVSLVICLFSGFVPINTELSFQRTMAFLPFFIMGFYSNRIDVKYVVSKIPIMVAVFVFVIFTFIIYTKYNINWNHITYCNISYRNSVYNSYIPMLEQRAMFVLLAIVLGSMFMKLCYISNSKGFNRLSSVGRKTLFIYVWHSFCVQLCSLLIIKRIIPNNSLFLLIYALIIMFVLVRLSDNKILNLIQNPINWIKTN